MRVVQLCTAKANALGGGIKKYEDELYYHMLKIIKEENLDIKLSRILRNSGAITGSMIFSWFGKYSCQNADVIHATSQVIAPVKVIKNCKNFIVTVHDLAPMIYREEIQDFSEYIQWLLTPETLKYVDKIIAISHFTKNEIAKYTGIDDDKITVIHQGVNHEKYHPMDRDDCLKYFKLNPEKKYILYVASNLPHKRVDLAKAVFEEIQKCRDDVMMIKAGYSERLEGNNIISMGWIDEKDMPKLYNCADVYIHTSEYEGFGLPVLEAMACGVPVVAFNRASIPEIVGKGGYLAEDTAEFTEKVLKSLECKRLCKKARVRSMRFGWDKTARETLRIYTSYNI